MLQVIMGFIWTVTSCYGLGWAIGRIVKGEVLILTPLFIGFISIISILLAIKYFKKVYVDFKRDFKTSVKGEKLIGIIAGVAEVKNKMGSSALYEAEVGVLMSGTNAIKHFKTVLNLGEQYEIGDYVHVKYYQNDINIIRLAEDIDIPVLVKDYLHFYPHFYTHGYSGEYFLGNQACQDVAAVMINNTAYPVEKVQYADEYGNNFYSGDSGMFYKD